MIWAAPRETAHGADRCVNSEMHDRHRDDPHPRLNSLESQARALRPIDLTWLHQRTERPFAGVRRADAILSDDPYNPIVTGCSARERQFRQR